MSDKSLTVIPQFNELGLTASLLKTIKKEGYSEPTPIQAKIIPHIISGNDVVGQAQTGTGKTAAFALPLLNNVKKGSNGGPRVLVLAPTRELALQISDSFVRYGASIPRLNVLSIFGGADYSSQLKKLARGVDIVVGTPGRVMDHIRRKSLILSNIEAIVLDEADEMLKMGFIDDVEWILSQAPEKRQIALFSATMPQSIKRVAASYLHNPIEVTISSGTATVSAIEQRYLSVRSMAEKRKVLTTILEVEEFDGVLIFVRTKIQTVELAEYLAEQGYDVMALNGDIPQNQRLRTVEQLKSGKIDIVVTTDVAARGLDVDRVSHVVNFDISFDVESYVHRIGRTGRAGRRGKAILFVAQRERSMLKEIERNTRQKIAPLKLPTTAEINAKRIDDYKQRITNTLAGDCTFFSEIIKTYCQEQGVAVEHVAAALAKMVQGEKPLLVENELQPAVKKSKARKFDNLGGRNGNTPGNDHRKNRKPDPGMNRYRIEIGELDGVKPANIVGAIANEAEIDSEYIGRISISDEFSTVDLPDGMPRAIQKILFNARINGKLMRLRKETDGEDRNRTGSNSGVKHRKKRTRNPHGKMNRAKRKGNSVGAA